MRVVALERLVLRGVVIAGLVGIAACATSQPPSRGGAPSGSGTVSSTANRPGARASKKQTRLLTLADLRGRKVLWVAHPVPHLLEAIRAVLDAKLLGMPKLQVVGIFHRRERETYARTRAYLVRIHDRRFGLLGIDCPIAAADVYRKNACSPTFSRLVSASVGMIFPGGADIPPALYGQKTRLTTLLRTPRRQYWELSLLAHLLGTGRNPKLKPLLAARPRYPLLGICMGMQAVNVATGGTLVQDIPSEIYGVTTYEAIGALPPDARHRSFKAYLHPEGRIPPGVYHHLRFAGAKTFWARLTPGLVSPMVLSIHHQAVKKLGTGLEIIATSVDGKVPEALRHTRFHQVLALQFHPEYYARDRAIALGKLKGRPLGPPPPKDAVSTGFHRRLWKLFGERLRASAVAPVAAPGR